MDSIRDQNKANEIINRIRIDLGINDEWSIDIKKEFDKFAHPNSCRKRIEFDEEFFEKLNDKEFGAVVVHEFYHVLAGCKEVIILFVGLVPIIIIAGYLILKLNGFAITLALIFVALTLVVLWILMFFRLHKLEEIKADKFVKDNYPDYNFDMISALRELKVLIDSRNIDRSYFLHHPTFEDRIERLSDC
jgi:Zn-dependent protease with chaperone function